MIVLLFFLSFLGIIKQKVFKLFALSVNEKLPPPPFFAGKEDGQCLCPEGERRRELNFPLSLLFFWNSLLEAFFPPEGLGLESPFPSALSGGPFS